MDSLPLCPQGRDQPFGGGTAYFLRLIAAPALPHFMGSSFPPPHTQAALGRPPVQGPRCLPLFSASPALVPSLSGCFLTIPPCRDLFCLMSRALFIGPIIRHLILCLPCPALIVVVVVGDLWVLLWREQRSRCLQLSSIIELARDRHTVTA